ncbi:MAG TPA: 16S rRNA (uracil(1498)-N(3))-methyltransferase [Thermodesulfobacteriota bacterium]|nr:16S rRNA (uracil(1498)-N(3))-methyltransferase [Thermodesulfobacteriota bacterium]
MHRFFVPPEQINLSSPWVSGQEARHLTKVMRMKTGDRVILFDNTNREYAARISDIIGDKVYFTIEDQKTMVRESNLRISLGLPLIRHQPFEWILQKGTELGVAAFHPFYSGRSRRDFGKMEAAGKRARWERIIIEAAKQCERNVLPELNEPIPFDQLIAQDLGELKIIPYEQEASRTLAELEWTGSLQNPVCAMVGPEGGFRKEEIEQAREKGFITVSLGPRILRSETATLALVCLLQYRWGDMGQRR